MEIRPVFTITANIGECTKDGTATILFDIPNFVPAIKSVIVRDRVTVVIRNDGSKTRSTCAPEDTFDPSIGIGQCLLKKVYGKRKLERIIKKIQYQPCQKKC
jgi:hypothetical protein